MAYFDTKTGSLEEAIKAAVGGKLDEERTYTVVHATKGKEVIKAKTSYDAAKKFAQMKRLKSTAGVDASGTTTLPCCNRGLATLRFAPMMTSQHHDVTTPKD